MADVFTLQELAAYLKLPEDIIEREATRGLIPGRRIEDSWRFLKAAVDDWLKTYDARLILLQQAGTLADDDSLLELLASIYASRGRAEVEADEQ